MTVGFIIAAGNQSRFNSEIPKALSIYNGKSILDTNLELMESYCDECYVVCSTQNEKYFNYKNKIIIKSGLGCGDAVLKALSNYVFNHKYNYDTYCYIQWGDSIQTKDVYESIKPRLNIIQIPYYIEENPYVHLVMNKCNHIDKVLFKKFGEINNIKNGYHDCSLFYGNIYIIKEACEIFKEHYYKDNCYRNIGHGNEFNFLDIFNVLCTDALGVLVEKDIPIAFNTIEELNKIGGYIENERIS